MGMTARDLAILLANTVPYAPLDRRTEALRIAARYFRLMAHTETVGHRPTGVAASCAQIPTMRGTPRATNHADHAGG